jgi:hypothetical protein
MKKNQLLASFEFNSQDRTDRPEGELIKSVNVTPKDNKGQFTIVGGAHTSFYERRGALNASLRFAIGDYVIVSPNIHLYSGTNPDRVAGVIGWIATDALPGLPGNGSADTKVNLALRGKVLSMDLPTRRYDVDGKEEARVHLTSSWLQIVTLADGRRGKLENAPTDAKTGLNFGEILHSYVRALAEGTRLSIMTTFDWHFTKQVWMSSIHDKAVWLQSQVAKDDLDVAALRQELGENRLAFQVNAQIDKQVEARIDQEIEKPEFVIVDGSQVAFDALPSGMYRVNFVDGRNHKPVVTLLANAAGYNRKLQLASQGFVFETVRTM